MHTCAIEKGKDVLQVTRILSIPFHYFMQNSFVDNERVTERHPSSSLAHLGCVHSVIESLVLLPGEHSLNYAGPISINIPVAFDC